MAETLFTDELIDSVRLSLVAGVGPLLRKALIERFGGDSVRQLRAHVEAAAERIAARLQRPARPASQSA